MLALDSAPLANSPFPVITWVTKVEKQLLHITVFSSVKWGDKPILLTGGSCWLQEKERGRGLARCCHTKVFNTRRLLPQYAHDSQSQSFLPSLSEFQTHPSTRGLDHLTWMLGHWASLRHGDVSTP